MAAIVPVERTAVPEVPALEVEAAVDAEIALGGGARGARARMVDVEVVAEHGHRHARAPLLGIDVAACLAPHRDLRDAEVEPQIVEVEAERGLVDGLTDAQAGAVVRQRGEPARPQAGQVDAEPLQQGLVEAGLCIEHAGRGAEWHLDAAGPLAVHVDVRAIHAGPDHVALRVARHVDRAAAVVQEAAFELDAGELRLGDLQGRAVGHVGGLRRPRVGFPGGEDREQQRACRFQSGNGFRLQYPHHLVAFPEVDT